MSDERITDADALIPRSPSASKRFMELSMYAIETSTLEKGGR